MDAPVDRLKLAKLPQRRGPLAFLFANPETLVFQFDHEQVTRAAADLLATLYNHLAGPGIGALFVEMNTPGKSYKGLARNTAQLFALANLVLARRWLPDAGSQVAP